MFKYLKSKFIRRRIVALVVASSIATVHILSPKLSDTQDISSTMTSKVSSEISVVNQIVVSTVIPNTSAENMSKEVIEEVRYQETLEKEIIAEIEEEARLKAIEEYREYVSSIVCDPTDVSKVSGLKESDFKLLTEGTWWEGNEAALVELEEQYGINAMFAMSVSTLESGFGKSDRAQSRNNYYGLEVSKSWDSLYDNTQYWGNLISKYYVDQGRSSVSSISTKYCPPNSEYWASYNAQKMVDLYNQLINRLNDTSL